MTGMFKILNIRPTSSFLSQPALDSILNHGHMPDEWKSQRHFGRDKEHPGPLHIPCVTGIWHNGDNHFVVVYICPTYWTIIDPLYDHPNTRSTMNANIRSALHKAYNTKGLPTPCLPNYRPIHKIASQNDGRSGAWSCGTYAMLTTLHIILSDTRPDQLQPNSISRRNMSNFHEALLHWYILGIPPDLWELQCLSHEISSLPRTAPAPDTTWPCGIQASVRLRRRPLYIPPHPTGHPGTIGGAPPTPWNPHLDQETIEPPDTTNPKSHSAHNLISSSDDSDSDSPRPETSPPKQRPPQSTPLCALSPIYPTSRATRPQPPGQVTHTPDYIPPPTQGNNPKHKCTHRPPAPKKHRENPPPSRHAQLHIRARPRSKPTVAYKKLESQLLNGERQSANVT